MTLINYDFQKELISNGKREDGRGLNDYRDFSAEVGLIDNANGSARVKFGDTDVLAGVKFSVGTPYPDSPDEGMFMVSMELNPLSSPDYEPGPPKPAAIEISRVVDRAIRESKTLDFKDLSIVKGETAWMCSIDIYPNPATHFITIENNNRIKNITILDIQSRVVYSEKVNSERRIIDVSHLSNGVYIVEVSTSNTVIRKEFVISNENK